MTNATVIGEHEGAPSGRHSPVMGCAVVLVVLPILIMGLFVTCIYFGPRAGPSVGEVRDSVDEALEPGAAVEEIQAYLRSSDIDYRFDGGVERAADFTLLVDEYSLHPDTPIFTAFAGETGSGGVTVVFVLDENERYSRLIVVERFGL